MKPTIRLLTITLMLAGALSICIPLGAQQATQSSALRFQSYDVRREVNLLGTVVKYDAASSVAPIGAHLLLQTSSGQVDVHLGNAKVLQANHFELNPGDNVRIIGEELAFGNGAIFAARIVQKGVQAVAVRNTKGALTSPAATMSSAQIEALRGVR
ncbi:MAG: hypothetical protein ACHQLQ_03810 [Candidatus Acidiferrales bacterium]